MLETQHYHLKKPEPDIDPADVQVINENMDKLDEVVGGHLEDKAVHTSAEEKARIAVDIASKVTAATSGAHSWDDLLRKPSGYYLVVPETSGMPENNCYWHCQVISDGRDISGNYSRTFIAFRTNTINKFHQSPWVKNIINSNEFDWFQLATTQPPQEIALPLSEGYTKMTSHKCCYSKSQDGTVLVHIAINHTSGTLPNGYNKIGQLPVGLYPTEIIGIKYPDGGVFANPDGSVNTSFATDYTWFVETLTFRV